MEDGVVKQGFLYLQQQQTFGKKWRKFWGVLYSGGVCAAACLELLDGSGPSSTETAKKGGSSKHLIKLSDCVHVAESAGEANSPKETIPFFLETTEKCYLLAAERTEAADWILVICEHAFLKSREDWKTVVEKDFLKGKATSVLMAENTLYSSSCKASAKEFPVTVKATQASECCQLWGRFLLRAKVDALELCSIQKGDVFYTWPYKFLRRFGHDKVMFMFEAGRRCASGEGSFEFLTKQGDEIIQVIEAAINAQRAAEMSDRCKGGSLNNSLKTSLLVRATSEARSYEEGTSGKKVTSVTEGQPSHAATTKSLSLGSSCPGNPSNRGRLMKPIPSCPLPSTRFSYLELSHSLPRRDPQYGPGMLENAGKMKAPQVKGEHDLEHEESLDSASNSLPSRGGNHPRQTAREAPTPLVACDRSDTLGFTLAGSGLEHVYDNPETLAHVVYDEPQEIKGEAWKLQATAEDPVGHEYPYNPYLDDYSVPRMAASSTLRLSGRDKNSLDESAFDKMIQRFKKNQNAQ
ncbi:docking protein 2 isoform X2 [Heteronotia binoei]|uniref:docking protein 2 isoform X2 n=1 Tax=Heteronotia binoei TaxID=13085 RepID=UPI0029307FED|nr:docking protein 2 isoform X2 [Heteronotia binoei]